MTDIVERLDALIAAARELSQETEALTLPVAEDAKAEILRLRHDIERHVSIAAEQATEIERLKAIIASFNSSPSN